MFLELAGERSPQFFVADEQAIDVVVVERVAAVLHLVVVNA